MLSVLFNNECIEHAFIFLLYVGTFCTLKNLEPHKYIHFSYV